MKILVTGAQGFIGKNLTAELKNRNYTGLLLCTKDTDPSLLDAYCQEADFVFHLAGVNRPREPEEFMRGNYVFTSRLLEALKRHKNPCPVMLSSSIQAKLDNPYGKSKKAAENLLLAYGQEAGAKTLIYRFPHVFGKWGRPNYNSTVATFCHNIARDLPISVTDGNKIMNLVYVDDVIEELINALKGNENRVGTFCEVAVVHTISLGEIVDLIYTFKKSREELSIPDMSAAFTKKLYSTYLSYQPEGSFSYNLTMNRDARGSFTEFMKTADRGQVSVNISKPGITKGNHWHHTKNEKFLVVSGTGVIRIRRIDSHDIREIFVSGDKMQVVDIPVGHTHNIKNLGDQDMVTIIWASEPFSPDKPDTYYLEV